MNKGMAKGSFIILLILTINLVSAIPPIRSVSTTQGLTVSTNLAEAIQYNTTREWEIHILNSTKLISSGASCTLHIYNEYGNGGHSYINTSATFVNQDIEIIAPPSAHQFKGEYSYKVYCNTTGEAGLYESTYYATESGKMPSDDFFTTVIHLLFIICLISLFYTFIVTLTNLVTGQETVYSVMLSWGAYILLLIVNYLGKEYILRSFIENITGALLYPAAWTNGVLPIVAFILTIFLKGMEKKKPISVQDLSGFRMVRNG